jgi:hypothetical protein
MMTAGTTKDKQTGKQRLECVLNGQVPDVPPHWELVFQIEKEMFGMDPAAQQLAPRQKSNSRRNRT